VEVAEILFKNGFHGLPVIKDDKVVGIITENDFFIKDQAVLFLPSYINFLKENQMMGDMPEEKKKKIKMLLNLEAKDIMTPDPVTVSRDMEVSELLEFIKKTRFNTMPVADENKNLLGVVTLVDVIGMVKQGRMGDNSFNPKSVEDVTKNANANSGVIGKMKSWFE
jgi:CBS domain-containing protein